MGTSPILMNTQPISERKCHSSSCVAGWSLVHHPIPTENDGKTDREFKGNQPKVGRFNN